MAIRFPGSDGDAIASELSEIDLGDERLNARLLAVARAMAEMPRSSFAGMCSSEAEQEGLYRLLRNPRVASEDIAEVHIAETVTRSEKCGEVLVVHDTTEMKIPDDAELESFLGRKRRGFRLHQSLVIDAASNRTPLGICAQEVILRRHEKSKLKKANGKRMGSAERAKLRDKEFARWQRGIDSASQRLRTVRRIHVMDSEADAYSLFAHLRSSGEDFVIRLCQERRTRNSTGNEERLAAALATAKTFQRTRNVHISGRKGHRAPERAKARPARDQRKADLSLSFCTTRILRPRDCDAAPEEIEICIVRALELNPPEGTPAIDWKLATSLPVRTKADVERVIDIYRKRWLIEEYFHALKSGCGLHQRRLTNASSILNSLAIFVPIAWRALWLTQRAREAGENSALDDFSRSELTVLKLSMKKRSFPEIDDLTIHEAMLLIAEYGGHRRRSGPPGWKTLTRGFQKLLPRVEGWDLRDALGM